MKTFLALILLLSFAAPVFSGGEPEKVVSQCLKPSVLVYTPEDQGYGTAFVVRSELVGNKYRNVAVSCYHNIEDNNVIKIVVMNYDKNGKLLGHTKVTGIEYLSEKKEDLTVLLFETTEKCEVVKLAPFDYQPKFGEWVKKIGFGLGDDATLEDGKITGVYSRQPTVFTGMIRTNMNIVPGDSGGPLFTSKNEVIGVNNSMRSMGPHLYHNRSYFTPMSKFKTWDDKVNNALAFVYNRKEKMPVMAFSIMRMSQYEPVGEENAVLYRTHAGKTGH
jgi:S1-C subfamily serine protease